MLARWTLALLLPVTACGARTQLQILADSDAAIQTPGPSDAAVDPAPETPPDALATDTLLDQAAEALLDGDLPPPGPRSLWVGGEGMHTCVIRAGGSLYCWGNNLDGQVGNGSSGDYAMVPFHLKIPPVSQVTLGGSHSCALTADQAVWCWGDNSQGQLGNGTTEDLATPVQMVGGYTFVAAGGHHTCGASPDSDGWLWSHCWGANDAGQLGLGTIGGFYGKPQSLIYNKPLDPSATLPFTAGHRHSCSVWGQGAPVCWGDNLYGQLGGPLEPIVPVPQTGVSLPGVAVQLVSGMRHSCAMLLNGQVLCWGEGGYGQLGHGSDTDSKTPVQTAIPASTVLGIAAGGAHGCLRTWAGEVHCWGLNGRGQLGVGSHTQSNMPMPVPLQGIVDIAAGAEHTCAVLSDGTVWCWGANDLGQLGLGFAGQDQLSPVQVTGLP